eukprot:scaffold235716_cov22-Tisochrysis_lutea.AAC.1
MAPVSVNVWAACRVHILIHACKLYAQSFRTFQFQARGPLRRFYTPYEVAQHNTPSDCWVSFLGGVYDISKLIK